MQYLICLNFKTEGAEICICAFKPPKKPSCMARMTHFWFWLFNCCAQWLLRWALPWTDIETWKLSGPHYWDEGVLWRAVLPLLQDEGPVHKELSEGCRSKGGGGGRKTEDKMHYSPSPEDAGGSSHHPTEELTHFPLPCFSTTQPRGFPSACSKKGSLKPCSLWPRRDGKKAVT